MSRQGLIAIRRKRRQLKPWRLHRLSQALTMARFKHRLEVAVPWHEYKSGALGFSAVADLGGYPGFVIIRAGMCASKHFRRRWIAAIRYARTKRVPVLFMDDTLTKEEMFMELMRWKFDAERGHLIRVTHRVPPAVREELARGKKIIPLAVYDS